MTAWIKLPGLKMWPSGVSLALKSPWDRVAVCHCHADEPASGILSNDSATSIEGEKELIFVLNECQLCQRAPCTTALVPGKLGSSGRTLDLQHTTKEEWWGQLSFAGSGQQKV